MKRGSHSVYVPGPHRALTGSTCPMWHLSYARCAHHSSGLKYVAEGGFPSISESTSHENTVPIKTFRNNFSNWQSQPEAPERYQSLDIWGARASTLVNSGWTPRRINWHHLMWAEYRGYKLVFWSPYRSYGDAKKAKLVEGWRGKETGTRNQATKKDAGLLFEMGKVQEALSGPSINNLDFQDHRKVKWSF